MTNLSDNDPPPDARRGRVSLPLVVAIVAIVVAVVVLHLTGVVGPGAH